ncbi:uncharacterized protein LOC132473432 isoform X1 [Gadus macrocephalus]|uniref:uncharacterized protein LOC132473432 isoform X1 n=1 Tax=Gadus macrocephalus TaxID=80720 RepID=UPI0028CB621D|nr:uncharacterized protein LOC132473432 isoform X1 [Gadus macrocephalus]
MLRRRSAGERKPQVVEQEAPPPLRAHPQLQVQLQKFTVSADKTLSWLKENVGLATQVCSVVAQDGLEAARRCQEALEKEILSNGTRIEVVKREGRGLIRAQHPGSEKIETFLGQLEFLWEELRRRHQRNAGFLQASEELGFRVLKALQGLSGLEAWLEAVDLTLSHEASVAGDPHSMSVAERESRLLEREVSARGLELDALRLEVERLGEGQGPDQDHDHDHARARAHDLDHAHDRAHGELPGRLAAVERKYQRVQSALTQQSSELQDTRMLTEFLERVELEESQDPSQYRLAQPLHSDITSDPSPLALPGGGLGEPLIESLGDPVGELREAVEMLNDTVRQRGRTQSHDQAVRSLLSKHARVAVRVEECLCCSKELNMDVLERETDLAVRCEPESCGLEELEEQQDQLEIDYEVIREEVEDMGSEASRLEQLCPERLQVPGGSRIQNTLQAWKELESSMAENRSRLQEFIQLKYFFRSYLAMISWTEDTRACIFSDSALSLGRDGQEPIATELDRQIEQKFQEFDELASTGVNLLRREHHLTEMVKERMEELRSMLGWISVHWRAQKQQWLDRLKREEGSQDNIYCEAAMGSPLTESSTPRPEVYQCLRPLGASPREDTQTPRSDSQPASPGSRPAQRPDPGQEDDYEVMTRVGGRPGGEAAKPTVMVLKEPGGAALGGTVNLLLSLRSTGDSQVQVLEPPAGVEEELQVGGSEPVHRPAESPACKSFWRRCQGLLENTFGSLKRKRKIYRQSADEVSTYLHVKDSGIALTPVYESITLPRLKTYASSQVATPSCSTAAPYSSSSTSSTSSSTSSSSPLATLAPGVFFHPTARGGASMFSSLKRMGQKRKRKRDARRHTIQRIMGVDERAGAAPRYGREGVAYDTHTWPLKEGRRRKQSAAKSPVRVGGRGRGGDGGGEEDTAYMKNPLLMDIDSECSGEYSITPYAVCGGPQVRSHCRFLSLGSVLSFELPKDMSVIPSIQDIITIAPPECKKAAGADPEQQRPRSLSSFKHTPPTPHSLRVYPGYPEVVVKDTPDAGEATPRHPHPHQPHPPFPGEVADQTVPCTDLRGTSGPGLQEDPETEWDKMSQLQVSSSADADEDYVVMEGSGRLRQLSADGGPRGDPARGDGASNVNAVLVAAAAAAAAPSAMRGRHECLSVHTLIQDLDKHQYHRAAGLQGEERPPAQVQSQASHMVVNLKAAVGVGGLNDSLDSGVSSTGSARLCAEAPCPDVVPRPRAVVRRLVSLELEGLDCKLARVTSGQAPVEPPPPPPPPRSPPAPNEAGGELEAGVEGEGQPFRTDHRQFEEEEEELEDIWNRTRSYRQSICSDIMYQPHQEEEEAPAAPCRQGEPPLDTPLSPAAKPQAVLYRKLVTASAPNLLVAEFKLPPSIQSLLGYDREKPAGERLPLVAKGERRSWACESSSAVVNEVVKRTDVVDTQRYVYRYGDEEEEVEVEEDAEVAKKGEEEEQVKEDTACLQEQSVSLLSVLRNPEGASRIGTTLKSSGEMENQDPRMATGGRCRTTSGKAELQSMEGTLERKHKLQLGGKKAASRGWNSHHAVLYRHSLCFYQDRKDTLRSSVCGLPLNLVGAECEPVPEYTKKPNVLCLRLRDGSEYLLNASSRFMMRKWMLKIQANTGPTSPAPSVSPGPVNQDLPVSSSRSLCPGCQGTDRCHCSSRPDLISTFPRREDRSPPQAKEIVVLTREYSPMTQGGQSTEQSRAVAPAEAEPRGDDDDDDDDDDAVAGLRSLSGGSPGNSPPSSSPHSPGAAEKGWLQNKCRSHSFTSATYQKIRPVRKLTPAVGGGGELGSSYSVTLVIGDRSSGDQGGPPASGGPEPPVLLGTAGWTHRAPPGEDGAPWSYASLPRPARNKSVFKKIFGKKEGHV